MRGRTHRIHTALAAAGLSFAMAIAPAAGARAEDVPKITPATTDPKVVGKWAVISLRTPCNAVHAIVLPQTGNWLFMCGSGNAIANFKAGTFKAFHYNVTTGVVTMLTTPNDFFCSINVLTDAGNPIFFGGTENYPGSEGNTTKLFTGTNHVTEFDEATMSFTPKADMAKKRWYPSGLRLGDGTMLVLGGQDETGKDTPVQEHYDPATDTFTTLPKTRLFPGYPSTVLMGDGRVFYSGVNAGTFANSLQPGLWDWQTDGYQVVPGLKTPSTRLQGRTILLPPAQAQKVLVVGGIGRNGAPATNDTAIVDLTAASPAYTSVQPLPVPQGIGQMGTVILPDRTLFASGGGTQQKLNPILYSAIFNPSTNKWLTTATPTVPRVYHENMVLTANGTVMVSGSNPNGSYETRIEVYSPPYLFKGVRPNVTAAPSQLDYGGTGQITFTAAYNAHIKTVSLISPNSTTHSVDSDLRLVDLPFTEVGNTLNVTMNANPNIAPPGWYMLFIADGTGRPSVAKWVHVSPPAGP